MMRPDMRSDAATFRIDAHTPRCLLLMPPSLYSYANIQLSIMPHSPAIRPMGRPRSYTIRKIRGHGSHSQLAKRCV